MKNLKLLKYISVATILVILILTVLEFPAPIGFEVRPQDNVSMWWLVLFLTILISEIAAISFLFKKPLWGARLGVLAGALNIIQIFADQLHLMQPEIAPFGYLILEDAVGVLSVVLIYFCWSILKENK